MSVPSALRRTFSCREASLLCRGLGGGLRSSLAVGRQHRTLSSENVSGAGEVQEVVVREGMTVADLAKVLKTTPWKILKAVRSHRERADGYSSVLPVEVSELVAMEMGHTPVSAKSGDASCLPRDPQALRPRPPVVTVMGHVDHGKTTLLDYLRKTSVASREAGGITQHVGAFSVTLSTGDRLTFLDTPGHAAFSAMRARGASVTDIVVLVVAADDGVKVQTRECIELVKAAGVPLVVAINKCDKHGVNVSRVKRDLLQCGVQLEEFGGDVQAVEISALNGTGVLQLEEALLVQAELSAVKGDPGGMVEGVVLEAHLDRGLGAVASVIVQHGTLHCGDVLVAGNGWCKVRKMLNDLGKPVGAAPPSAPVLTVGWSDMPMAGDKCLQLESKRIARKVLEYRATAAGQRNAVQQSVVVGEEVRSVTVVVKGDVVGSVEALVGVLEQNQPQGLPLNVLFSGAGAVSEGDVELAASTNSVILAYGVPSMKAVSAIAKQKGVTILSHNVIYKLLEQLKTHLESLLPWVEEEEVLGEAVVLRVFKLTGAKAADVGGCRVKIGRLVRSANYRLVRDGVVIHEGQLSAMKHGKVDVDVARKETECGLSFTTNPGWKEGDRVIAFTTHRVPPKLTWNMGF